VARPVGRRAARLVRRVARPRGRGRPHPRRPRRVDLAGALLARLEWPQRAALDADAPTHVEVPSGSRLPVDYADPGARCSRCGCRSCSASPRPPPSRAAACRSPCTCSPPRARPMQVTRDLAGFWRTATSTCARSSAAATPKHPWPDDPPTAVPTNRAKRRGE
jgi:ATP-dependent helicase HrpB